MIDWLVTALRQNAERAIFLAPAIGYFVGPRSADTSPASFGTMQDMPKSNLFTLGYTITNAVGNVFADNLVRRHRRNFR